MKRSIRPLVLLLGCIAVYPVSAAPPAPYDGQERRDIKALSPEEINDYLAGKGMGLAKAAELNRYPGPAHVLELAEPLQLSAAQKRRTEQVFNAMQAEARRQGAVLVERERALDRRFASGTIGAEELRSLLAEIGRVQAEIRRIHLHAHLEQKTILTPAQVDKYHALRGYGSHAGHAHRH